MTVFQASIVLPAKDPHPYCFPRCFLPFRLQSPDDRGDIFSTLPQREDVPSKIGIQGGRHTFALTTTVNSLSKITLRIRFLPSKYSLVSTSAIFTCTSTVSTHTSTILRSIDTRVVWVTIFNHYCKCLPLEKHFCSLFRASHCTDSKCQTFEDHGRKQSSVREHLQWPEDKCRSSANILE